MSRRAMMSRRQAVAAAGACLGLALGACTNEGAETDVPAVEETPEVDDVLEETPEADPESEPEPEPELASEVDRIISGMTLEQKVAQLFVVRPEAVTGVSVQTAAGEATRQALQAMRARRRLRA